MSERAVSMEPGVYKTENGKFGFLAASRDFTGDLSRSKARELSRAAGLKTTTRGVYVEPADIVVEVPVPEETPENRVEVEMPPVRGEETPKRRYQSRRFETYAHGETMASIPLESKKSNNRFYMAAYMHRRNHPESDFSFRTEDSEGRRHYICVRLSVDA